MNEPVAVLDLDGTLTDSRPGITASLRAALHGLGHATDPTEDFTAVIGPPMEQTLERLLARWGDFRVSEAAALYRRHYNETGMYDNSVYPGVAAALAAFSACGWTLFVALAASATSKG
jgi:phosphoglycolate phosphatase